MTNYTDAGIDGPRGIAVGPDGALWFTNSKKKTIGRITTNGGVSIFGGPGINTKGPVGITTGADGALWFTNPGSNSIGRITAVPELTPSPSSAGPGAEVTMTGEGYQPGEKVAVKYQTGVTSPSSVPLCTATAATDGTMSCSGGIPTGASAGAVGSHEIKATGKNSLAEASTTFTLTSG